MVTVADMLCLRPSAGNGILQQVRKQTLPPNRLAELRRGAGFKLYDIASKLRVDPSTVYRWERGDTTMPDSHKLTLARLYGVSPAYLMGWDSPEDVAA